MMKEDHLTSHSWKRTAQVESNGLEQAWQLESGFV